MANLKRVAWPGLLVALVVTAGVVTLCGIGFFTSGEKTRDGSRIVRSITGSGSTAQKGAMDAWRAEFRRMHPDFRVDYRANGSGAGIRDFIAGATAFAGSDVVMSSEEQGRADRRCGGRALHLPMVIGPVAVAYNLPSVPDLRLSPGTLTGIFSGRITRWDAKEIAADNPGVRLPDARVRPVHRAGESGTTHNFTAFLRAMGRWPHEPSMVWRGAGPAIGGSDGIVQVIQYSEGSIGYVEYGYASNARLRIAKIRNASGRFVELSPESATRAMEGARVVDGEHGPIVRFDYRTRIPGAYPIVMITYEIACEGEPDPLVRTFLSYTAGDAGQSYLALYGYAPLPHDILASVRTRLGLSS
ncbi:phosphate ABC transporter substrate-binding protein PstS [Nonomuraea fuscirosea]|uniref:phosphate ABC transporter substrate-binding protein PstS n=1 Tax=Nonomuraea fuscirosea TaxID=1291556 RepID=UPI0015E77F21|nr:phosphate ABC transporter substrate-binding protein PstS [Nonomuraea fuscirosea]